MKFLVIIAFIVCFNNVSCVDNCAFSTCSECISFPHDNCVWCAQVSYYKSFICYTITDTLYRFLREESNTSLNEVLV